MRVNMKMARPRRI